MNQRVGIAWYKPWEWEKLREAVSDPEKLEATHREWRRGAIKVLRRLRENSVSCERVVVSVEELVARSALAWKRGQLSRTQIPCNRGSCQPGRP